MDRQAFVARFGAVYEHSPWIAETVHEGLGDSVPDGPAALNRFFEAVIRAAGHERQLELLRAHPQLACGRAPRTGLTAASRQEQSGAGLDQCSAAEFEAFRSLNARYQEKFGFPFIVAVKGRGRAEILRIFRARLANPAEAEFQEALHQVLRIGELRIEAALDG